MFTNSSITEELEAPLPLEVFETDCYKWHLALRANSAFNAKYGRYPDAKVNIFSQN